MKRAVMTSFFFSLLIFSLSCASSKHVERPFVGEGTGELGLDLVPSVHFDFGSEKVLSRRGWVLKNNARWMREHPDAFIILEGHCDSRGGDEFNLELGDRRARGVRDELVELGVPSHSLIIVSYGESRPLDPIHIQKNRRVAFVIR